LRITVKAKNHMWWYRETPFADQVEGLPRIVLRVNGRDCQMVHAVRGKDCRETHAFSFVLDVDREFWSGLRGQDVTLEVVHLAAAEVAVPPEMIAQQRPVAVAPGPAGGPLNNYFVRTGWTEQKLPILCIGLDLAWFGGSRNDRDSQFDCLAYVALTRDGPADYGLKRVSLASAPTGDENLYANFDINSELLLGALEELVAQHKDHAVVLAIDAPLQAQPATARAIKQDGLRRRACENLLQETCSATATVWRPNIQPGFPLAQRVLSLLHSLTNLGYALFPKLARFQIIECFPVEAQWSAAARGGFARLAPLEARSYKNCGSGALPLHLYSRFTIDALDGLAPVCGLEIRGWNTIVCSILDRLSRDTRWIDSQTGHGRGGKLFDDAIDATIALCVAIAFAKGAAHVWMQNAGEDGHIIGPGY
jgi:hypothetical protein